MGVVVHLRRLGTIAITVLLLTTLFAGLAAGAGTSTSTKYVAFRDDDVNAQPGALKTVNQVHIDKNVPVTLAIVPHPNVNQAGNQLLSNPTTSYLQTIATNPLFEFAQHGYTHYDDVHNTASTPVLTGIGTPKDFTDAESPYVATRAGVPLTGAGTSNSEFAGRPYADQYNDIKQGRDDIIQALGVTPTTFVPPWNEGDDNTAKAVSALGFTLYSTGTADFSVREASMYGITVQGSTFDLGWDGYSNWQTGMQDLTQQTDAALDAAVNGERIVITYHFWAFERSDGSIDPGCIALFSQYLDHLKGRGDVAFTTLGGQFSHQGAAVCADGADNLLLFAKGADNALWYKRGAPSTKQWSAWTSLGGGISSAPAAVALGSGMITVFVRGGDGALWTKSTTNGGSSWSSWTSLGGGILAETGPAASPRTGGYDVFVTGNNHALWQKTVASSGTVGWHSLGGYLSSSPAAASRSAGTTNVFARGGDGALWTKSTTNGGSSWSSWTSLGGGILADTAPAVAARTGSVNVFVIGDNNALWHKNWQNGAWSSWISLNGYLTSSPTATWRGDSVGTLDVFARGGDAGLWWKTGTAPSSSAT